MAWSQSRANHSNWKSRISYQNASANVLISAQGCTYGADVAILRETLPAFVRIWCTYAGPLEREDNDDQAEALFDAFLDEVARGVRG